MKIMVKNNLFGLSKSKKSHKNWDEENILVKKFTELTQKLNWESNY